MTIPDFNPKDSKKRPSPDINQENTAGFKEGEDFRTVKLRTRKYDDGVLLTNDYGKWLFLFKKEYEDFLFGNMSEELFKKLEESFMIITDANMDRVAHQINDYYWHISNGTSLHIIVPTLRCNFTCRYCYAFRAPLDKKDVDMDEKVMEKTIDFIFKSPSKTYSIEFTGGEPLLKWDLVKKAILKAEKMGKENNKTTLFSIVTNGIYLKEDMLEFLEEHKVGLCLSLDGPKDLHDKNRKYTETGKGTYESVIKTLDMLKKHKYPSVNAIPVIVNDSLNLWKDIVDEYVKQGFNSVRFKYISRFGFASKAWEQMSYSPEEYLDKWKKTINYMIELNKKGIEVSENIASMILFKLIRNLDAGYAELQIPCGAVIGQVVYDYDGSIYTCDEGRTMPEFKVGDVFTSEYKDLLNCPVTKTLQSVSNLTATCDECPWFTYCGICPLEIYNTEKGFITNIPANYRCKIHKGMFEFIFEKILHDPEAKKHMYKWPFYKRGVMGIYENNPITTPFKENETSTKGAKEEEEDATIRITEIATD